MIGFLSDRPYQVRAELLDEQGEFGGDLGDLPSLK